jgi:uncharacterized phiE125 gp8 family phage protein
MGFESLKRTTDATVEPVTLADMKAFMRIEPSDDAENALITALITAARQRVEECLNRALITQSWTRVSDNSPQRIMLEYPPLQSVTSIKSYADDNTATTNSSDNYTVVTTTEPGQVLLKPGSAWTTHRGQASFEIIFVAGYGDAATDVPMGIIQGIKVLVTKLYHRRGDDIDVLINEADVMGWLSTFKAY